MLSIVALGVTAGCTQDEPSPQAGSCIKTSGGIEVVDCDSEEAQYRLVRSAGTTFDQTDANCPAGSEAVGIRPVEGGVGQRWCGEEV